MTDPIIRRTVLAILATILLTFTGCGRPGRFNDRMDQAEHLMESRPDSALSILSTIDKSRLAGDETKARYALLMSMALDKNYIDTTNFDVLQPAIDYYLEKGTPDEKLRTYYYQGRVYQNIPNFDLAMQSFLKAGDLKEEITDTLTYANLLVAQGHIHYNTFLISNFIANNIAASQLYLKIGKTNFAFSSLLKALGGCIINKKKYQADSLLSVVETLTSNDKNLQSELAFKKFSYKIKFGNENEIKDCLNLMSDLPEADNDTKFCMVLGFLKIRNPRMAQKIFNTIDPDSLDGQTLKYLIIKTDVCEALGDYKNAFSAYKEYSDKNEKENSKIFLQKSTMVKERHNLTVENIRRIQKKDKIIWMSVSGVCFLIILLGFLYFQLRISKAKRKLMESEKSHLQLEKENLKNEKSMLELAKHNADLQCERQALANENLQHRISQLEIESDNLKELLHRNKLSIPISDAVKERIEILNGLLATEISDNATYSKPYKKWVNKITEDRNKFMDSTRLAFKVSHSKFIQYLEDHELNEAEINYACLYAIGLRGKEIGEYIQLKRHYHISSDIRKKLGLKEQETNLGIYIRRLMKKLS